MAAGFDYSAQSDPADRFPVRLVPLPRQRRSGGGGTTRPRRGHPGPEHRRLHPRNAGVSPQWLWAGRNTGNQFNFGYALQFARCNCPLAPERAAVPVRQQLDQARRQPHLQVRRRHPPGHEPAHSERPPSRRRAQLRCGAHAGADRRRLGTGFIPARRRERVRALRQQRSPTRKNDRTAGSSTGRTSGASTNKLTINYGLRWEIYRPQTVTGAGKGGFVDVDTGEVLVAGDPGRRSRSERRGDLDDACAAAWHRLPRDRQDGRADRLRARLRHRRLRFGLRPQRDAEPAGARDSVACSRRATSMRCSTSRRGRRRSIRQRFSITSRKDRTATRCCRTA